MCFLKKSIFGNHHHYPEHLPHPQKKPPTCQQVLLWRGTTSVLSVSVLACSRYSM